MPLRAWAQLPLAVATRLARRQSQAPWIVPDAVSYLARIIGRDAHVLEVGSGWSTIWYARRCGRLISLEHDPGWYAKVKKDLARSGIDNCDLHLVERAAMPETVARLEDGELDVVVIDGVDRMACLAVARSKVKRGGYVVLDDSDWSEHREADVLLRGWERRRFVGVKPAPLLASETTVYRNVNGASSR